jgi:hypothetical protein
MGREERRRAERERHRQEKRGAEDGGRLGWAPPAGQLKSAQFLTSPDDVDRQRQDFLAGTVFAAGAGIVTPDQGPTEQLRPMAPMFTVFVNEDDSTFGPAPQLREAFRLLDMHGAVKLHELLTVGTAWAAMDDAECPLIKLKLEFHAPMTGNTAIVLLAQNYAQCWQHIVDGGMIGITTFDRLKRAGAISRGDVPTAGVMAQPAGGATFADAMDASILLGIGASPGIRYLMDNHGW